MSLLQKRKGGPFYRVVWLPGDGMKQSCAGNKGQGRSAAFRQIAVERTAQRQSAASACKTAHAQATLGTIRYKVRRVPRQQDAHDERCDGSVKGAAGVLR